MTMVTQIPITLVTGISELVKLDVIKEMKRKDKSNVILYRDLNVTYKKSSEEFTLDEKRLTSVIHDLVADNKKDLLSIINIVQNNDGTNHIVIDVEMEATLQLLTRFGMTEKDPLPIQNHIHVVDANKFWFQYASMDSLLKASIIEETTEMYIGELLGAQLELANMIVLANADHLNEERLSELFWFISKLNPLANILTMSDFKQNNTIFKGSKKHHTPEELYTYQLETFMPKTPLKLVGDFGIDTYIYQSTHPISLERLEEFFSNLPDGTLRTKGRCYVPYNNEIHYISHIGPTIEVFSEEFVHYKKAAKEYLTEFLFIGDQLEPLDIKKRLDNCLLIDEIPNFKESLT